MNVPNPLDIYNLYLNKLDKETMVKRKEDANGHYFASGAGLCIVKHYYDFKGVDKKEKDNTSKRLLRLGTIVGNDFEDAMQWYNDGSVGFTLHTEGHIVDDDYNISGHFDLLIVNDDTGEGYLYDYKTANSYKFKMLFGRNPDSSPSTNYEYQLGTYGMMLNKSDTYCDKIVYMANLYINKNNSVVKTKEASLDYIDFAEGYWKSVNKYRGDKKPDFGSFAPAYSWECNKYCDFLDICDSPLKKQ